MFNIKICYLDFENKVTEKKIKTKKLNTKTRTADGKITPIIYILLLCVVHHLY